MRNGVNLPSEVVAQSAAGEVCRCAGGDGAGGHEREGRDENADPAYGGGTWLLAAWSRMGEYIDHVCSNGEGREILRGRFRGPEPRRMAGGGPCAVTGWRGGRHLRTCGRPSIECGCGSPRRPADHRTGKSSVDVSRYMNPMTNCYRPLRRIPVSTPGNDGRATARRLFPIPCKVSFEDPPEHHTYATYPQLA